ncbi:MAG: IclR family transcriptional regulator [Phycisphaerae bacterium]|nr:IclR family transcriptional regulator [Phycisphaerae bacterium]
MELNIIKLVNQLATRQSKYKVPNLVRGLSMLELLCQYPDGLAMTEIAQKMGWPKNSTSRVAMTLVDYGYVNRDESSRVFSVSRKLLYMGTAATGEVSLVNKSWDILRQIRDYTQETVLLGTLAGTQGVVLEQVLSKFAFKYQIDIGTNYDLHASAPGKALLAYLPEVEQDEIVKQIKFTHYTDRTITTKKAFIDELSLVKKYGYSTDNAEMIEGCHCVGAPIFNGSHYPIAAIWATGPANRLKESRFAEIGQELILAAKQISERLI